MPNMIKWIYSVIKTRIKILSILFITMPLVSSSVGLSVKIRKFSFTIVSTDAQFLEEPLSDENIKWFACLVQKNIKILGGLNIDINIFVHRGGDGVLIYDIVVPGGKYQVRAAPRVFNYRAFLCDLYVNVVKIKIIQPSLRCDLYLEVMPADKAERTNASFIEFGSLPSYKVFAFTKKRRHPISDAVLFDPY